MTTDETLNRIQQDTLRWQQQRDNLLRQQGEAVQQLQSQQAQQAALDEFRRNNQQPPLNNAQTQQQQQLWQQINENTNRQIAEQNAQNTRALEEAIRQRQATEQAAMERARQDAFNRTRQAGDAAFNNYQDGLSRQRANDAALPDALRKLEQARLEAQKAASDLRAIREGKLSPGGGNSGGGGRSGGLGNVAPARPGGGGGAPTQTRNSPPPFATPPANGRPPGGGMAANMGAGFLGGMLQQGMNNLFNGFMQRQGFQQNNNFNPYFGGFTQNQNDNNQWERYQPPDYPPLGGMLGGLFPPLGDDPGNPPVPPTQQFGQVPGKWYIVRWKADLEVYFPNGTLANRFVGNPENVRLPGPIGGISWYNDGSNLWVKIQHGQGFHLSQLGFGFGSAGYIARPSIISITPENGQQDPPVPGQNHNPTNQPPPGNIDFSGLGNSGTGGNAPGTDGNAPSNSPGAGGGVGGFSPRGDNRPAGGGFPGQFNLPGANFNPGNNPFPDPTPDPGFLTPGTTDPANGSSDRSQNAMNPVRGNLGGGLSFGTSSATQPGQGLGQRANNQPGITDQTNGQPNLNPGNQAANIPNVFPPLLFNPQNPNNALDNTPQPPQPPYQTPPENSCCRPTLAKLDEIQAGQNNLGQTIQNNALDALIKADTAEILNRVGPQVPGGLSGFLGEKFTKLWKSKAVDRALALMNLAASLHNAAMLSRSLATTLGAVIENVLAIIGIKDPDDKVSSLQEVLGNTVEGMVKAVIGEQNYINLTTEWKKANIIYNAAINTYQLLSDSFYTLAEGMELVGQYNSKIGNALKKGGVVMENAYEWMSETFNFHSKRNTIIDRVAENLQTANTISSDLEEITSNIREAGENLNEIKELKTGMKEDLAAAETSRKNQEKAAKDGSPSPDITLTDIFKNL